MSKVLMAVGAVLVLTQVFVLNPSWAVTSVGLGLCAIGALLHMGEVEARHVRDGDFD